MKKNVLVIVVMISLVAWGCSKVETGNRDLKQSVEKGVADISHAVTKISGTTGYQLLALNETAAKSDYTSNDTISLSMVAGIYDFQPDTILRYHNFCRYRLFTKTGESENMIVNMPEALAFHPKYLHFYEPVDTVYPNNFTITATDYHLYYNRWHNYEYKLTAGLTLNDENAGSMDVSSSSDSYHSTSNSSKFTFSDGYNIAAHWQKGDTSKSSFHLSRENDTLFKESSTVIWNGHHKSEKQYILTIGTVELRKTTGIDSIQVFVGGVLQQNAAEIITDDSDTTGSVCEKRDILLTYDDGTTAKLSDLLEPVREQLGMLRESLRSMYFSKHIVDYIAFSIYYEDHEYDD